ncbi:outer membrane protein transport protein [Thalassoglobus sp. JC818]|uniref:OmpP1/FadL family transporter n=1 Tax=Thalassoglobus sp. JC818 TaxID=3232136 RepID=UPI0034598E0F
MKQFKRAFATLFCVVVFAQSGYAEGTYLYGISSRAIGRGGTNVAHRDNGALIYDNPAGIAAVSGNGLIDIGIDTLITDFSYSDPDNRTTSDSTISPLPQLSMVRRSSDGVWAAGLGVFTPAGFGQSYKLNGPFPFLGPQEYNSFGSLTKILPSLAWAPTDRLRIGGTAGVGVTYTSIRLPYFLQEPGPTQGTPVYLDLRGTGAAFVWSLGLQYDLTEVTTLGVTYQSETDMKLDGPARVTIPLAGTARYDADTEIVWPQSVAFGVKHELMPFHTISADIIWTDWASAYDAFKVTLSDPSLAFFPEVTENFPLDWKDGFVFKFGYELETESLGTFRVGYVHNDNPIPNNTLTPLIQSFSQNGFTAGYGCCWADWDIDLSYMYAFGSDRTVGNSDFIGGDFDNARHTNESHAISISAIKRF